VSKPLDPELKRGVIEVVGLGLSSGEAAIPGISRATVDRILAEPD
jgi:hypothetical protein